MGGEKVEEDIEASGSVGGVVGGGPMMAEGTRALRSRGGERESCSGEAQGLMRVVLFFKTTHEEA